MKKRDIDKSSYHYQAASWLVNEYYVADNLCKYVWQVIGGVSLRLTILFIVVAFATAVVYATFIPYIAFLLDGIPVLYLFDHAIDPDHPYWMLTPFIMGHAIVALILLLIGVLYFVEWKKHVNHVKSHERYEYYKQHGHWPEDVDQTPPGFLTLWYQSFKQKTCVKLNFVDPKDEVS